MKPKPQLTPPLSPKTQKARRHQALKKIIPTKPSHHEVLAAIVAGVLQSCYCRRIKLLNPQPDAHKEVQALLHVRALVPAGRARRVGASRVDWRRCLRIQTMDNFLTLREFLFKRKARMVKARDTRELRRTVMRRRQDHPKLKQEGG
ncbi:unnamed protein product [Symbiodinium natans]|uniref:Uncharacterized protein n=1 Tax=Symbiodinium natans TaxID=878477 RepID=A0A812I9R5_9DINO|nr:unnamed protein product [Symbiodinium natans]